MDIVSGLIVAGLIGYWVFLQDSEERRRQRAAQEALRAERQEQERHAEDRWRAQAAQWEAQHPLFADTKSCFEQQYVSFTRIKTYCSCPRKFKLIYLDRCEPIDSLGYDVYRRGTVFHKAVANYLRQYCGRKLANPSAAALLASHPQADALDLSEAAKFFCETFPGEALVVAVEHELSYVANGIRFYGIVDAVLQHPDATIELIDFKTGRNAHPAREQLEIYSLPFAQGKFRPPVRLRFMLVDRKYHYGWNLSATQSQQVGEYIAGIIKKILADDQFAPIDRHCNKMCPVGCYCPYQSSRRRRRARLAGVKRAKRRGNRRKMLPKLTTIRCRALKDGGIGYFETPEETNLRGRKPKVAKRSRHSTAARPSNSEGRAKGTGKSYDLVSAAWNCICCESGSPIGKGTLHFADHKGHHMSVREFQKAFPETFREKSIKFAQAIKAAAYSLVKANTARVCWYCGGEIDAGLEHFMHGIWGRLHRLCYEKVVLRFSTR